MPMASTSHIITRCILFSKTKASSFTFLNRLFYHNIPAAKPPSFSNPFSAAKIVRPPSPIFSFSRPFCTPSDTPVPKKRNPKLVNFSLPSESESDSESEKPTNKQLDRSKLPPPYDPFKNKPVLEEPEDPKNLQEVFAKIRDDGLMNSAVKMFDGLSQEGLTHEALELFSQIKDKGQMPDVVAHTAVMEAYVNAGQAKEAHKVYLRMLASGVLPNAYTYRVVIKGLAESGDEKMTKEAVKYVGEMIGRGMRPNAGTCVGVFEGLAKIGLEDEGKTMLEMLKEKGVVPDENKVREALKNKRGAVYRTIMSVVYGK